MRISGLQPYITEHPHPISIEASGPELESYEVFAARYGNIYTIRQCLELFRQATGIMPIIHDYATNDGKWFDLLRPGVIKDGFLSLREAKADRIFHLSKVREMFATANVFIFTLGLTEHWYNKAANHTYPACPGTVRGQFDPDMHVFGNSTCQEVVADLERFILEATAFNPGIKLIFTVSPVPLVATRSAKNVLVASMYSKSVLRAAIGQVEPNHSNVDYFPSYEIISSPASFGQYLTSDLREVTERGVSHVMDCFISSYYTQQSCSMSNKTGAQQEATGCQIPSLLDRLPDECEELYNDAGFKGR
jgi:hypothetical protein